MLKRYLLRISVDIIIWIIAISFFIFLREFGQDVLREFNPLKSYQYVAIHLILGTIAGILFGSIQMVFERFVYKKVSLGLAMLLGSFGFLIAVFFFLSFAILLFYNLLDEKLHLISYKELLFSNEFLPFIIYSFLVTFIINFLTEIDKKFGPGNLRMMLTGKFYTPKEEDRIFMFIDLRSSTTIAEKLGHLKYSELIQDCFKDIAVVKRFKAEIYQYVGDEAVLTWKTENGLKNFRCINTFLAFQKKIESRKHYYLERYGVVPEFKAGVHSGKIIVAEVGEIKREIAYHGDTINTASRIQDECNILGKNFLISEDIVSNLPETGEFTFQYEANIQLRGKSQVKTIFSLTKNN